MLPGSATIIQSKLSGVLSSSGFVRKYSQEFKKDVGGLSRGALLALDGYYWPGNVRQLEVRSAVRTAAKSTAHPTASSPTASGWLSGGRQHLQNAKALCCQWGPWNETPKET